MKTALLFLCLVLIKGLTSQLNESNEVDTYAIDIENVTTTITNQTFIRLPETENTIFDYTSVTLTLTSNDITTSDMPEESNFTQNGNQSTAGHEEVQKSMPINTSHNCSSFTRSPSIPIIQSMNIVNLSTDGNDQAVSTMMLYLLAMSIMVSVSLLLYTWTKTCTAIRIRTSVV